MLEKLQEVINPKKGLLNVIKSNTKKMIEADALNKMGNYEEAVLIFLTQRIMILIGNR